MISRRKFPEKQERPIALKPCFIMLLTNNSSIFGIARHDPHGLNRHEALGTMKKTESSSDAGITILVVDDNAVSLTLTTHIIKQLGYKALTADNGITCIDLLAPRYFKWVSQN